MRTLITRTCASCGKIEEVRSDSLHRLCRNCAAKQAANRPHVLLANRLAHIGKVSPMKGRAHTVEAKAKNRSAHIGKRHSVNTEFKKGLTPPNKKTIDESLLIDLYRGGMSAKQAGVRVGLSRPCAIKRLKALGVAIRDSSEELRRRNLARPPHEHPLWKGGITPKSVMIRQSGPYKEWRTQVFARDDFSCQHCDTRGGRLHADHIKPFALFPELRFDVNNGRTLCIPCHKKTPTYLRSNLKREDFMPLVPVS